MIAIPSAFTPNNDGINDIYRIPATEGTVIATMKIYSRWGQLLYDDMADLGWDGTYGGVAQPNATYTCFVTYYQKLHPNIIFSKMGTFDLLR
jgi:gliding motility-associated-like protein